MTERPERISAFSLFAADIAENKKFREFKEVIDKHLDRKLRNFRDNIDDLLDHRFSKTKDSIRDLERRIISLESK